jgi:hypothetical protein
MALRRGDGYLQDRFYRNVIGADDSDRFRRRSTVQIIGERKRWRCLPELAQQSHFRRGAGVGRLMTGLLVAVSGSRRAAVSCRPGPHAADDGKESPENICSIDTDSTRRFHLGIKGGSGPCLVGVQALFTTDNTVASSVNGEIISEVGGEALLQKILIVP